MDELNKYFENARELKLEKQLINDAKLNSIINKKQITNNLIKGAGAMSILTIITIGLMFLFSEEKPEQKFDPETMRKLPIFHLTIEELEELGISNFPKSYDEYVQISTKSNFLKSDSALLALNIYFGYKKKRFLQNDLTGNFRSSFGNENYSEDIKLKRKFINFEIEKIYKILEKKESIFIKNKNFIYKKDKIKGIVNLVPISVIDDFGYITDFFIWFTPTQILYDKLPERYKKTFKMHFQITDDIVVNEIELQKFIQKEKEIKENRVNKVLKTIDLTHSEAIDLGIDVENEIVKIIFGATGEKTNRIQYYEYEFDLTGEKSSSKIYKNVNKDLIPEILYINKYKDNVLGTSSMFTVLNKFNILNDGFINELRSKNGNIEITYDKNKKIEEKINRVIPIKFLINISETEYIEYILWYRLTDELISKLPERYNRRFIEEIELIDKVLSNEIELKEVCKELKNESLLGICVAESVNQVNVYPNPTRDNLNIKIDIENDKQIIIKIFDTAGREIFSTNRKVKNGENDLEINTNNFSRGIYIINIFENEEILFSRNIVIE